MQAKLDELIRAIEDTRGTFIAIGHLFDQHIPEIRTALEADCAKEPDKYEGMGATMETSVGRLLEGF